MENYSENNPSEMLNLFADGELDSGLHSSLFGQMSESTELQQEMSELIAIRESVKNDSEAFAPPAGAKRAIMARIGLTDSHKVAPLPIAGGIASLFGRIRVPLAFAALGSLMTLWIVSSGDNEIANDSAAKIPVVSSFNTNELTVNVPKESFAGVMTPSEVADDKIVATSDGSVLASIPVANDQNQFADDTEFASPNLPVQISMSDLAVASAKDRDYGYLNNSGYYHVASFVSLPFGSVQDDMTNDLFVGKSFGLTFRMSGVSSFSAGEIAENDVALQNGMNFGLYLPATSNLLIGIELGNEQFSQPFTEERFGRKIEYNKSPDVFWAAVSAHYTFDSDLILNGRIKPFVQTAVGGSESGMIWKCISGLQYNVHGRIGASLGIEYGGLGYTPENSFQTSHKIGLTYGMYYKI